MLARSIDGLVLDQGCDPTMAGFSPDYCSDNNIRGCVCVHALNH